MTLNVYFWGKTMALSLGASNAISSTSQTRTKFKSAQKFIFFYLPFQVRKGHFPQVIINHPTTISRLRGVSIWVKVGNLPFKKMTLPTADFLVWEVEMTDQLNHNDALLQNSVNHERKKETKNPFWHPVVCSMTFNVMVIITDEASLHMTENQS